MGGNALQSWRVERAGLRAAIEDALAFLCDEGGYTLEEGGAAVVLRIEPITGMRASR
jgi:hypothetical protein